jgi:hypothetical protein
VAIFENLGSDGEKYTMGYSLLRFLKSAKLLRARSGGEKL